MSCGDTALTWKAAKVFVGLVEGKVLQRSRVQYKLPCRGKDALRL
jgi:hypothetical protein